MSKVVEQIDKVLIKNLKPDDVGMADFEVTEHIFEMLLEFVASLEPDQLNENQLERLHDIIEALEPVEQEEDEMSEVRYLKKTTRKERRKSAIYRRRHKTQIKRWRRKMKHKLKRAKKTGRGISGKRLGLTRRRPGART